MPRERKNADNYMYVTIFTLDEDAVKHRYWSQLALAVHLAVVEQLFFMLPNIHNVQ